MSVLRVNHLYVRSGAAVLVDEVSLALQRGASLVLLGETGAGKSLVLAALMGTLPPELRASGTIELFNHKSQAGDQAARRSSWGSRIALLPQEPWTALDPTMRCLPQVAEGFDKVNRQHREERRGTELASESFQRLGLSGALQEWPHALSGGMAQRVAFAAVRAGGANLLLADEPTKGLDAGLRQTVIETLQQASQEGGSLLVVTHDVAVARQLGGRMAVMWKGRIVEEGSTERLLQQPHHPYTRELVAADPATWPRRHHPAVGPVLLSATGISKTFGSQEVFRDWNLEVREGERMAISGPSGSGKSTLGNVLLGLLPPDTGTIQRTQDAPRWKFQKLYQDPVAAFAPRVTIRQSLRDLVPLHRLSWKAVIESMIRLQLADVLLDRFPAQVSGGELQRFALLRALLLRPRFLFADEPTSRLDLITQRQVMDILLESTAQQGCALLVVTHDAEMAQNVAPRSIDLTLAG